MSSIFSKIIAREIPSDIVYEDDEIIAIHDINPQAKTHILIIPKKEIETINDISLEDTQLIWNMFHVAKKIAYDTWISQGYQLKFNVWEKGGQEVFHIHLHLTSNI